MIEEILMLLADQNRIDAPKDALYMLTKEVCVENNDELDEFQLDEIYAARFAKREPNKES